MSLLSLVKEFLVGTESLNIADSSFNNLKKDLLERTDESNVTWIISSACLAIQKVCHCIQNEHSQEKSEKDAVNMFYMCAERNLMATLTNVSHAGLLQAFASGNIKECLARLPFNDFVAMLQAPDPSDPVASKTALFDKAIEGTSRRSEVSLGKNPVDIYKEIVQKSFSKAQDPNVRNVLDAVLDVLGYDPVKLAEVGENCGVTEELQLFKFDKIAFSSKYDQFLDAISDAIDEAEREKVSEASVDTDAEREKVSEAFMDIKHTLDKGSVLPLWQEFFKGVKSLNMADMGFNENVNIVVYHPDKATPVMVKQLASYISKYFISNFEREKDIARYAEAFFDAVQKSGKTAISGLKSLNAIEDYSTGHLERIAQRVEYQDFVQAVTGEASTAEKYTGDDLVRRFNDFYAGLSEEKKLDFYECYGAYASAADAGDNLALANLVNETVLNAMIAQYTESLPGNVIE